MSDVKRVRYFNGEYLVADDFNQDQEYHRKMRYRHNKEFHSWGIAAGLDVTFNPTGDPPGSEVVVSPGMAADKEGREIIMDASASIDFNTPDYNAGDNYYITITWNQKESDPDENGKAKRWDETPVIRVSKQVPENPGIDLILALVTLDEFKAISTVDNDVRRISTINIGSGAVTSSRIAEADGVSGQDTNSGAGVKTGHIQDLAVTESKLAQPVQNQLALVDTHDHTAGQGSQIKHGSLNFNDGPNPHGVSMSQLTNYNANSNRIFNLSNPSNSNDAANKIYVDGKTGGTASSVSDLTGINTAHTRQINVSNTSSATKDYTQVNTTYNSIAKKEYSQINSSYASDTTAIHSQVNSCHVGSTYGDYSQINASHTSSSSSAGRHSQVNASYYSMVDTYASQINASRAVRSKSSYTVCGGYGSGTTPITLNRKWELNSYNGNISHSGSVTTNFSDYGEFFENAKIGEIDIGLLIALEGAKVRPAKKDEDFIGVVSGTAAIRLGDTPFHWHGRFQHDKWGRPEYNEIGDPDWEPKKVPDKKWKPKKGQTEAHRPLIAVQDESERPKIKVQKESKDYKPDEEQIPRSQRPGEWTLVGLLGQVYVRCDKTVQPGDYVKSSANGIGTKSAEKTRLRAMKITTPFDGKYTVVYCLLQ